MRVAIIVILYLSLGVLSLVKAEEKTLLNIAAIDWCPQICPNSVNKPGYLVEIVYNLFADSPYQIDIKTYPWSRAISLVRFGKADALLSPSKEEAPDFFYHQVPLSYQVHCFFKRADDAWSYHNEDQLLTKNVVIYQDHSYGQILKKYLAADKSGMFVLPYSDGYIQQAIELVRAKRADTFLFTVNSVTNHLLKNNISDIKRDQCIKKDQLWLALSPTDVTKNEKVAHHIDSRLKDFIKTKSYKAILKKYHISFPKLVDQTKKN